MGRCKVCAMQLYHFVLVLFSRRMLDTRGIKGLDPGGGRVREGAGGGYRREGEDRQGPHRSESKLLLLLLLLVLVLLLLLLLLCLLMLLLFLCFCCCCCCCS